MRAPRPVASLLAILRGLVQLAALSLILSGVIADIRWVGLALVVMLGAAIVVATRRIGGTRHHAGVIAVGLGAGTIVSVLVVFGTGALDPSPRYLLALAGIVIGSGMSVATLAGRGLLQGANDRWEEIEGWLALGARPRQATVDLVRRTVYSSLIPATDQTRTTGLVTLPGAFVGAIFGGVSPLEAGRFQIVVLAAIMASGAIAAVLVTTLLAPMRERPALPR